MVYVVAHHFIMFVIHVEKVVHNYVVVLVKRFDTYLFAYYVSY